MRYAEASFARMEPTGRANARPMTGSAKSGNHATSAPDCASLHPGYSRVICPSGGLLTGLSSLISDFPKNILVPTHPKSNLEFSLSHPLQGRIAIVTDAGWDAVDAAASGAQRGCRAGWRKARERSNGELTNDVAAYGEVVWS